MRLNCLRSRSLTRTLISDGHGLIQRVCIPGLGGNCDTFVVPGYFAYGTSDRGACRRPDAGSHAAANRSDGRAGAGAHARPGQSSLGVRTGLGVHIARYYVDSLPVHAGHRDESGRHGSATH